MLLLLCLAAGYVDVIGYLHQKVFAANMTGNTVLAVMSLAVRDWAGAIERASTLLAFFAGATTSALLMRRRRGQSGRMSLWLEVALLATACALDPKGPEWLGLVTAAMGIQATVLDTNQASVGVLERCGFEREGLLRHYRQVRGEPRDFWMYARTCPQQERAAASPRKT